MFWVPPPSFTNAIDVRMNRLNEYDTVNICVEFLDFGDFRKSLSMLSELAKLESTTSSEFY